MNSGLEGPARSLLKSFTVATTPPPSRPTADVSDAYQPMEVIPQQQLSENGISDGVSSAPSRTHILRSVKPNGLEGEEEDPRPSFIAPQPAPARSSLVEVSGDRSAMSAAAVAAPPSGLVSSIWQSAWKSHGPSTLSAWHSFRPETPTRFSAWKLQSSRPATHDGVLIERTTEIGSRTPKFRYGSSSSSVPRASTAAAISVGQREVVSVTTPRRNTLSASGKRSLSWGPTNMSRGSVGESREDSSVLGGWPYPQEHVAPTSQFAFPTRTSSSSISKSFEALDRANRGTEGLIAPRPPPPLVRARQVTPDRASSFYRFNAGTAPLSSRPTPTAFAQQQQSPVTVQNGRRGDSTHVTPRVTVTNVRSTPQPRPFPNAVATTEISIEDEGATDAPYETSINGSDSAARKESSYGASEAADMAAGLLTPSHLTFRSLTEEYNQFSSDGAVGWVGLQVHLRRHTQSTQITALDLTCYRMQRAQWTWFTLEVLPQLQLLEVLRLVQMGLADDEVTELVRGSCGLCSHTANPRASPAERASPTTSTASRLKSLPRANITNDAATSTSTTGMTHSTPLHFLRVLDLSGNSISQRSCNHLGKMLLWMADSLEEVRLLGNPLKDYGMQTLAIYLSKLNVETLKGDPKLFPGTLRHQFRLAQEQGRTNPTSQQHPGEVVVEGKAKQEEGGTTNAIAELPIGPVLLDLRDCRASARGLSGILAAASRAHRLRVILLSHNVAGVTALLPLSPAVFQEARDIANQEEMAAEAATSTSAEDSVGSCMYRREPAPRRLRLAKTPLISSGALLRRQNAVFSDVQGFANSCALSILVFHSVPLCQTCSPVGCRELLLNIFFSCPQLTLLDLSDTFEWSLVSSEEQQRLVAEVNHRDALEQRLRGPEVQRGLQMYREDQGEVGFVLDSTTVAGQTRLGDIFGELMAHAAYNAVVRRRVVPAAFTHVRELDLNSTGLTDAGVRGLCASVRRGRTRTGMLANLSVLNLSDNLLTARGCLRVISSFLLDDVDEAHGGGLAQIQAAEKQPLTAIAKMTAIALQRNAGVEGGEGDADGVNEYTSEGTSEDESSPGRRGEGRALNSQKRSSNAYVCEVCTAAEAAVLRRAALRSAVRGSIEDGVPPLTVYFSAPPLNLCDASDDRNITATRRRRSSLSYSLGNGSVSVFYAGCDERGDIFCTCPHSRFFVPKGEAERRMSAGDSGARLVQTNAVTPHLTGQPPSRLSPSTSTFPQYTVAKVKTKNGGGVVVGTSDTHPLLTSQPAVPTAAQRSLLSALDIPRMPSSMPPRSPVDRRPEVRLPPRPSTAMNNTVDDASRLVNSAPLSASVNSVDNQITSSLSFPPPPSVFSHSSDAAATVNQPERVQAACQRQQPSQQSILQGAQQGWRDSLVSITGNSLGSLFMTKTDAGDEANAARNRTNMQSSGVADQGEEVKDNINSSTGRSGKRRAKPRASRTFVLSYDHPAGHFLCRAFNVLARPAPDPFGDGARAALAEDLLRALQQACAQASAHSDNSDDTAVSPQAAAVAVVGVESVKYLPPDLNSHANHKADNNAADSRWMRFEVTTTERKARIAQRLQEVLSVSWTAQCVCFAHLLQWMRDHVVAESCTEEGKKTTATDVADWDAVQVLEQAAQVSPTLHSKLEALHAGSAVAAVHARHLGTDEDFVKVAGDGDATHVLSLAQLHPRLWIEMGLVAVDAKEKQKGIEANVSPGQTTANRPARVATDREQEEEEDMYSALSAPDDISHRPQEQGKGDKGAGKDDKFSRIGSKPTQPRFLVVDLYAGTASTEGVQVEENRKAPQQSATGEKRDAAAPALPSPQQFGSAAASACVDAPSGRTGDAIETATAASTKAYPTANTFSVALRTKVSRSFDELTDSDEDEEQASTSMATPEKQTCDYSQQLKGDVRSSSPPLSLRSPEAKNEAGPQAEAPPQQQQQQRPTVTELPSVPTAASADKSETEDDAMVTDQLKGSRSSTERLLLRKEMTAIVSAEEKTTLMPQLPGGPTANNEWNKGKQAKAEGRSSSRSATPESRRDNGAQNDSTLPLVSQQRARPSNEDAPAHSGKPAARDVNNNDKKEDDEDFVVPPPIRVRRCPSELEGRVKTFTLSYTHQEGTAVCRAWRLLHSAMDNGAATAAVAAAEAHSPTAALAQMARECLCDDFLALLQPPDEDRKHAVLSVTLHGDSGAATAMLQVQVQTNERRATLANRLYDSNHGVRRGAGSNGRGSIVPLTVDQVDHFYFPRLTQLLRIHKLVADTVAQVEKFLETRPAVYSRVMKSYGNIGSLTHYYHGSATALEHELGISSWKELACNPSDDVASHAVAAPAEDVAYASATRSQLEVSSPTVANDRVMPEENEYVNNNNKSNSTVTDGASSGNAKRRERDLADGNSKNDTDTPSSTSLPAVKKVGSGNSLKPHLAAPTQAQGRPPTHPLRPPTPPHPITHSSSISFDEVTEESTSEAGPVVVLRGSTPSATPRSPSTPNMRNAQYYPLGYQITGATDEPRVSEFNRRDRRGGEADSDLGALSPMTSSSASPSMAHLTGAPPPPHTQQTLESSNIMSITKNDSKNQYNKNNKSSSNCTDTPRYLKTLTNAPESPPRLHPEPERMSSELNRPGAKPNAASVANPSHPGSASSTVAGGAEREKSEYERVLEGKYKRLMRVAYDGVARGSVPLEPQHQQKTVIGRGKWGTQKVELSLEWEILFVLTFEKSRTLGRSSRRAQMIVHPVGIGFECMSGDEASHQTGETSSLHSSMVNAMTMEGSGVHHPPGTGTLLMPKVSHSKKESSKSAASHLVITIQRPFSANEVGSSSSEIEKTLMANALLTVSSPSALSKAARLLSGGGGGNGGDDASNTSRGSVGANQMAQDFVYQLCQRVLTLDIEMKSSKHVQEALRLLKNSIRRATQAVERSMSNANLPPPPR